MKYSTRLDQFDEYIFSSLAKEVSRIENTTGTKVLNLGPGNPDFPPSQRYIKKLKSFLDHPKAHFYPGYQGIPNFIEGVKHWYNTRFSISLQDNQILPILGGKDGISHLGLTLLNPNDEVLIPDPGYPAFTGATLMVYAKPRYYSLTAKGEWLPNIQNLESLVTPKTKIIWLNYPSNPTGQMISRDRLTQLVIFAKKHKLWLIYDNPYSELYFGKERPLSIFEIPTAKEVAIELNSFSKTFSFAGYRMGWIVSNPKLITAFAKTKSQIDSGMMRPLQQLAGYALTHFDTKWYQAMLASYKARSVKIQALLTRYDLSVPQHTAGLYLWAKIPEGWDNSEDFSRYMLAQKQILLVPGTAFGKNGRYFVRASVCSDITNIERYK